MKAAILFCISALIIAAAACSKQIKNNDDNSCETKNADSDATATLYMKEGFITQNLFRVVYIAHEDQSKDEHGIRDKLKKRAVSYIERYIASEGRRLDGRVRSDIMRAIDSHGSMSKPDLCQENLNLYYFNIKMDNFKAYIFRISSERND